MFIFLDKKKTGNLTPPKKKKILHIEFSSQHRENFEVLIIKGYTRVVVGCSHSVLVFETNFEFGDNPIMA